MLNQLYENSRKNSCYNTVASKENKILKMNKKIKRNAHRFKITKGLVNSGNGSRPIIIDVRREEQTRSRLFSSLLPQYTCKRRASKTVFRESTTWTQRFTVCKSAYMTEINMGPGSNAPALKCHYFFTFYLSLDYTVNYFYLFPVLQNMQHKNHVAM